MLIRAGRGRGRLFGFLRANRGVAAVEFAILLPVIVLIYIGAGEVSQAVMTSRKVEALSRTLADLVSQQPTTAQNNPTVTPSTPAPPNATTSDMLQTMLNASTAIMAPASLNSLTMTVTAVDITNNALGLCCVAKVRWSYTQSGTLRPCGNLTPASPTQAPSATTISSAMMPSVAYLPFPVPVLIADVSYTYSPPLATNWINFGPTSRTSYMLPRTTGQVITVGPLTGGTGQSGTICY